MAAIQVMGKYPIQDVVANAGEGFVIAKINGTFICSCYAPPRWSNEQFHQMLDSMTEALIGRNPIIIGGDFNAWAVEWGSRQTNARGRSLLEALAKLDVRLLNDGNTSTFRRNGRESIIDVTFCSSSLVASTSWKVSEGFTYSDHQAIRVTVGRRNTRQTLSPASHERMWKTKNFDKELFVEALRPDIGLPNMTADELTAALTRACDTSMPRKREPRNSRRPAYWWNQELAELRSKCFSARRKLQRAKNETEKETRRVAYRIAKAALKWNIKQSKSNSFKELCREADANPWGDAYRITMAKLSGPITPAEKCPVKLKAIIEGLFPKHAPTEWPPTPYDDAPGVNADRNISNEELVAVAKALKPKKAPGPDGIPNVALKAAIQAYPDMFRLVMQKCLTEGRFPDRWKKQKLVLLPKPGKPPGDPASYRPICLLDTLGKLLERIILNRLSKYTESEHGLSEKQFGFRKGRSTVDAIRTVIERAEKAATKKRTGNRYCAVITIDVKNAFNNASWVAIANALHKMKVPAYLCEILKSYFQNRVLIYETNVGWKLIRVTAGVPQGSIIGPSLWNGMYDGVLTLKFLDGVEIVGFADDIVLTITGESLDELEFLAIRSIDTIGKWMQDAKLQIAHHKTEVLLVSNRKAVQRAVFTIGEHSIASTRSLKYLGVMIDDRLNFNCHVDYASDKAAKAINALSRIMPNNLGPSSNRRRLLASVSTSILRYGSPAWISALETKRNKTKLTSTFRLMALRVASAYRTISSEAVCVIAGMIPIDIILVEDSECYKRKDIRGIRKLMRTESLSKWQQEWNMATKGRWTHRMIPNLSVWTSRKHGEVNFYLTQFLSGHGCFRQYLHRFGHARSPMCPECGNVEETPEHVVFTCPRFNEPRREMPSLVAESLVEVMCRDEESWNAANSTITRILKELQHKWRADQRNGSA